MRIPVAAQRASMPESWGADGDFNAVIIRSRFAAVSATCCRGFAFLALTKRKARARAHGSAASAMLRQVAAHQKRIQMFPAGLLIIAFAAPDNRKSGTFAQPARGQVVFFHFEEHRPD